jgi:carbon monoxide dehydrogenase subunit G
MKIIKSLTINKPIDEVWEVLGNQFDKIDRWSSLISKSEVSGPSTMQGVNYSVRSTTTKTGISKQELTRFDTENHVLGYKSIAGTPPIIKQVNAEWRLTNNGNTTRLVLDFNAEMKGIGHIIAPIAKMKLGKVGDELLDDFKFYVENGKPHPRKKVVQ